jgi:gas vesicle protein
MGQHDDQPYIVIERRSGSLSGFLWGALVGAGVAMLFAPRSGREVRDEIRVGALRLRDRAEEAVRGVADSVTDTIGGVRGEVEGRIDAAREAFDAGRRAARETRRDMEVRVREVRAGVRGASDAMRRPDGATQATDAASLPPEGDDDLGV